MKYIDAERLKAELEKRLKNVRDYMNGAGMKYKGPKYFKAQGKESAYDALLNIIDSLQQEEPEVDLKKEIKEWVDLMVGASFPEQQDGAFISEVDYRSVIRQTALYFYELGLNANKEGK